MINTDKRTNHVRVRCAENRYVEAFDFLAKKDNLQEADILGQCEAHTCGEYQIFDVPEGHNIVGVFGLMSSTKFGTEQEPVKKFDTIRGLGFITMNLNAHCKWLGLVN